MPESPQVSTEALPCSAWRCPDGRSPGLTTLLGLTCRVNATGSVRRVMGFEQEPSDRRRQPGEIWDASEVSSS